MSILSQARCVYCGGPHQGRYSINITDDMEGEEVPLCDNCGAYPEPTCREIWDRIALQLRTTPPRAEAAESEER